ncbi:helix-turn-helix transcriptional regulator [Marinomonas sp. ef1]|uniref:helix-turn-helix transcriptional regulator n=1 Tax=Marinomonas sp. ef1 TaxID=2005043 RepID=UPI000C28882B|nr:AlpA family phage regulatory protein [Marinomonas sp. ef1]
MIEAKNTAQLLRTHDLMNMLRVSRATLWRIRQNKNFPKTIYFGSSTPYWRSQDINNWLADIKM